MNDNLNFTEVLYFVGTPLNRPSEDPDHSLYLWFIHDFKCKLELVSN